MDIDKLDNPAWHSLNETHQSLSIGNNEIKFYQPEICPFGGINSHHPDLISILKEYEQVNSLFIIGDKPEESTDLILEKELVCLQMICASPINIDYTENIIGLNERHQKQLVELVTRVQPGYFKDDTSSMGSYYGIFKSGQLVAVTGERMKMFGFTEISAVVTHPDFTGKGFAKQLVAYTVNQVFDQNIIPYLHVAESNTSAINLYERSGFATRRKISFWKMRRHIF